MTLDDGKIEEAITGVDQGAGIRVEIGELQNFANANVAGPDDLMTLAGRAAAGVSEGGELHEMAGLEPDALPPTHHVLIEPRAVPIERKVQLLRRADEVARASDARIQQVTVTYSESVHDVVIANSDGRYRTNTRVRTNFGIIAVARQGEVLESGFEAIRSTRGFETLTDQAVDECALSAARRAAQSAGAQPAPAGTYTVVLSSEAGGTLIHESVGHGLEADLNLKGMSVYSGRIGQKVASELITVIDDGTDPGQRGTATMDDEGTRTRRTVLIENGILRTYMSDRKHARKLGVPESGNGRRQSFRHLPLCRMTNTMIAPGASDPAEILASVGDGIFVRKMGGGQVEVVSGNFAFEVTESFRIREGRLAEPLRGATLVGQGPKLMSEIDMVGWDLGYSTGTCGKGGQGAPVADAQPTLRIPAVVIGGRVKA
ncbi:TldD/PmbA family protein [soil metagenome]